MYYTLKLWKQKCESIEQPQQYNIFVQVMLLLPKGKGEVYVTAGLKITHKKAENLVVKYESLQNCCLQPTKMLQQRKIMWGLQ